MLEAMQHRFLLATLSIALASCTTQGEARPLPLTTPTVSSSSATSHGLSRLKPAPKGFAETPPVTIAPKDRVIPILVYHHVRKQQGWGKSTWSWKMTVTPETFEKQMQWLNDHSYAAIDLDTYVSIMKGDTPGPQKPVVITFDDNNASQYAIAYPSLKKHGLMAVFYVITGRIGVGDLLSNDQLKEMAADGMDIESHTVTHRVLTGLSMSELDKELQNSRKTLEDLLGKPVRHVAYPGTSHNKTVREHAASAGYVTGTIMDPRAATAADDLYKLPRIMMTDDTNLQKILP